MRRRRDVIGYVVTPVEHRRRILQPFSVCHPDRPQHFIREGASACECGIQKAPSTDAIESASQAPQEKV